MAFGIRTLGQLKVKKVGALPAGALHLQDPPDLFFRTWNLLRKGCWLLAVEATVEAELDTDDDLAAR